jgi:peptidoglycan/LPS O-acetylase OafA/YrhL
VTEARGGSTFGDSRDPRGARNRTSLPALDGLRGVGCALVVLLHSWTVVPVPEIDKTGPLLGLFKSGSLGVTIFFVLGSFLVTRRLLDEIHCNGSIFVDRFWMRRLVRLGSQLYPLLLVMLIVSWFDRWDSWTADQNQRSILTASTFTLNWSLVDDLGGHREDIGHLWYLSVEQQFYAAWIFGLAWFGRFRWPLIGALTVAAVGTFVWRFHVIDVQGSVTAALRTTTRIDGLILGALAALVLPHLIRYRRIAAALTLPCLVTLALLVLYSPELDPYAFLEAQGIVFALVTTALVLGIVIAADDNGLAERMLALPPLTLLGRISFPLYLWHFPVFWASSRWAFGVDWPIRAVASLIVVSGIVYVMHRFVEQPVVRWLDHLRSPLAGSDPRMVPA